MTFNIVTVYIIVSLCTLYGGDCLVAYDCSLPQLNYTTVSIVDLPQCEYKVTPVNKTIIQGYIAQSIKKVEITALQCQIIYHRFIRLCKIWGRSEAATADSLTYPILLNGKEYEDIHRTGEYWVNYRTTLKGLRVNSTNLRDVTITGGTTYEGGCDGGDYRDAFGSWSNVVVTGSYTIDIREKKAILDISNQRVIFPLGLACRYSDEYFTNEDSTIYSWQTNFYSKCDFNFAR